VRLSYQYLYQESSQRACRGPEVPAYRCSSFPSNYPVTWMDSRGRKEWKTSLRVSSILFARYTFFPQVDKLPKLPPEFASYRLKFFLQTPSQSLSSQDRKPRSYYPCLKYTAGSLYSSVLFNDADKAL